MAVGTRPLLKWPVQHRQQQGFGICGMRSMTARAVGIGTVHSAMISYLAFGMARLADLTARGDQQPRSLRGVAPVAGQAVAIQGRLMAILARFKTVRHLVVARQAQRTWRPIQQPPHPAAMRGMTRCALAISERFMHHGLILNHQSLMAL